MGLSTRGSPAARPEAVPLLEVLEDGELDAGVGTQIVQAGRGLFGIVTTVLPGRFLDTNIGGGSSRVADADGAVYNSIDENGVNTSGLGSASTYLAFPLRADSGVFPLDARRPKRITYSAVVRRSAVQEDVGFELGARLDGFGIGSAFERTGVCLLSDEAKYGGNWTAAFRWLAADPVTYGVDSGVAPDAGWSLFEMQYLTAARSLILSLDGVTLLSLASADMPPGVVSSSWVFKLGATVYATGGSPGAGSSHYGQQRFLVELL